MDTHRKSTMGDMTESNKNLPEQLRQLAGSSWFIDDVSIMLGHAAQEIEQLRKRLDIESSKSKIAFFNSQEKTQQVNDAHLVLGSDSMASIIGMIEELHMSHLYKDFIGEIKSYWLKYGSLYGEAPPFGN